MGISANGDGNICRVPSIQRRLQGIVPDKRAPRLALRGVSDFAQSSPKFKRAMRLSNNRASSWRRPGL
jgi:hypothetical protein